MKQRKMLKLTPNVMLKSKPKGNVKLKRLKKKKSSLIVKYLKTRLRDIIRRVVLVLKIILLLGLSSVNALFLMVLLKY